MLDGFPNSAVIRFGYIILVVCILKWYESYILCYDTHSASFQGMGDLEDLKSPSICSHRVESLKT